MPRLHLKVTACASAMLIAAACEPSSVPEDGGSSAHDGGERDAPSGPMADWPPLLQLEPPELVESEGGGLAVPSVDGQSALVVHEGALFLEHASGERTLLLAPSELRHGEQLIELAPAATPLIDEGRALFERSESITEWYEPAVNGVEQGWTITRRPTASEGGLHVDLAVGEECLASRNLEHARA